MIDPVVRPMTAEDRAAVIELLTDSDPWKQLGYQGKDWDSYFTPLPQGRDSYVVDQGGRVAGIAVVRQKFLLGDYLELLGVADWARGKGLGKRLLAHVEAVCLREGEEPVRLCIGFQRPGRHFYEKQGYQEIGPMPNLLIPDSAEILLRKTRGTGEGEKKL